MSARFQLCALVAAWGLRLPAAFAADGPPVKSVTVQVDGETDIPRILELLGVREGDAYSAAETDVGLTRLADTGRFLAIRSRFDFERGELGVKLALVPRVLGIEIRFGGVGNSVPTTLAGDLTEVVGLSPGDPIFTEQIPSVRERVMTRLRERGFRAAQVVMSLEQQEGTRDMRVVASVVPGRRTMIRGADLVGFTNSDYGEVFDAFGFKSTGRSRNAKEASSLEIESPYDSIRMDEGIAEWNQRARGEGYYDFQLTISESPIEGGDVRLRIELNRGPRYDLRFHGNVEFWTRNLREKVTDRPLRLGVPLSLQEAETLVQRDYQASGFPDAMVRARVEEKPGRRIVHFDITEGPHYLLGQIRPVGAPESEAAALRQAVKDWLTPLQSPWRRMPYDDRFLRAELPKLVERFRGLGYLDARILEFRPVFEEGNPVVHVDLPLQLGEKYAVRSVQVSGNLSLEAKELDELVDIAPGEAADPVKTLVVRERLLARYRELGFLNVRIGDEESKIFKRNPETLEVDVEYTVEQGPLIRVGRSVVEGLRKTNEKVVLRELRKDTLSSGSIWTPSGMEELRRRLFNLSIFGNVDFEPVGGRILQRPNEQVPVEIQEKDLKIRLNESDPGAIEFGPGFRTDKGFIGFAELNYKNLGGWNREVLVRTQASKKLSEYRFVEQNYSFTYVEPYILDQRARLRFNTQYRKSDNNALNRVLVNSGYSEEATSVGFDTEFNLTRDIRWVQTLYKVDFTRIFDTASPQTFRIASVGTALTYDDRDNAFNPRRGWLIASGIEYASPQIGSKSFDTTNTDVNFAKFSQEATTYARLGSDVVMAFSVGYIKLWDFGGSVVPATKRPALGGVTTIRSLGQGALRFIENDVGDQQAYFGKAELRQPVFADLGVAYFIDMGEVDGIRNAAGGNGGRVSTGLRTGVGIGMRYTTIVGPIALDVAYNTNPPIVNGRSTEDLIKINFSIGTF